MGETNSIAIIGISARMPQSQNLKQFWDHLLSGKDLIQKFESPALPNLPNYIKAKGILDNIEQFDAPLFGISSREAECMDPQQRILLECSWEALENAGYDPIQTDQLIGVYASSSLSTYFIKNLLPKLLKTQYESQDESLMVMGTDKDFLASRISYKLNLKGPSKTIQTACSSSLVAVHDASQALLNFECDMALVAAASITCPKYHGYFFSEGSINSPAGQCKPFEESSDGTVIGNGAAVVVLKRYDDAIKDRDTIKGVILGSCVNNDGSEKIGYTAPSIKGQAFAIESALLNSNIDVETISFIEAHGTGTKLGDPVEIAALKTVYKKYTSKKQFCSLGALKANIGHLDAAAGIAGLIKCLLILKHKVVPPLCHFKKPNSELDLDNSPFFINKEPFSLTKKHFPIRGAISSFGIGGTNAHLVLEEAPSLLDSDTFSQGPFLFPISAQSPGALQSLLASYSKFLVDSQCSAPDLSFTLQVGRKSLKYRKCFIANTLPELRNKISKEFEREIYPIKAGRIYCNLPTSLKLDLPSFKMFIHENPAFQYLYENIVSSKFQIESFSENVMGCSLLLIMGTMLKRCVSDTIMFIGNDWAKIAASILNENISIEAFYDYLSACHGIDPDFQKLYTHFHEFLKSESIDNLKNEDDKRSVFIEIKPNLPNDLIDPYCCFIENIRHLWERGIEVKWVYFNQELKLNRVSAPTYPFEKHSFWINSPEEEGVFQETTKTSTNEIQNEHSLFEIVKNLWKKTLKVDNLKSDSNFFELGGDSLVGLEIADEIHKIFGVNISAQHFFENPNLKEQVEFLENFILEHLEDISEEKAAKILQIIEGDSL